MENTLGGKHPVWSQWTWLTQEDWTVGAGLEEKEEPSQPVSSSKERQVMFVGKLH